MTSNDKECSEFSTYTSCLLDAVHAMSTAVPQLHTRKTYVYHLHMVATVQVAHRVKLCHMQALKQSQLLPVNSPAHRAPPRKAPAASASPDAQQAQRWARRSDSVDTTQSAGVATHKDQDERNQNDDMSDVSSMHSLQLPLLDSSAARRALPAARPTVQSSVASGHHSPCLERLLVHVPLGQARSSPANLDGKGARRPAAGSQPLAALIDRVMARPGPNMR